MLAKRFAEYFVSDELAHERNRTWADEVCAHWMRSCAAMRHVLRCFCCVFQLQLMLMRIDPVHRIVGSKCVDNHRKHHLTQSAAGVIVANTVVFLMWRVSRFQRFMTRWFVHKPTEGAQSKFTSIL